MKISIILLANIFYSNRFYQISPPLTYNEHWFYPFVNPCDISSLLSSRGSHTPRHTHKRSVYTRISQEYVSYTNDSIIPLSVLLATREQSSMYP